MTAMAAAVVDRLSLTGDEVVLDAGCGTGRVSELLLERLPRGRVIAIDADDGMVRLARQKLGGRAEVRQGDLSALRLGESVDAILSTATFHWVLDHERLFGSLFAALRPGGSLVAQCGGEGNIADLRAAADAVAAQPPFAASFEGWSAPWYYAGPEETAERLTAAGFVGVRTWLEPWPVLPDEPDEYLATVTLGAQVQHLPDGLRSEYVAAVLDQLAQPVIVDYVRLNLDARRPPPGSLRGPRAADAGGAAGVAVEGEGDEAVDQVGVGDAARRPQPRVHRPRREAGDGVDLVHEQAPPALLVEEVHAGHALCPKCGSGGDGQTAHLLGHASGQHGRHDQLGAVV